MISRIPIPYLLLCGLLHARTDPYADRVVSYDAGSGPAPGYTRVESVLGEPSSFTPGDRGGPVTPFVPAWKPDQLLSVGAGGHVVLEFDPPIFDHAGNPWGLDFILHGNAGLVNTNSRPGEGRVTSGDVFGGFTEGQQRVSVSGDGEEWHELAPRHPSAAAEIHPTDHAGTWGVPVDPEIGAGDLAGADLERLREIYAGGAGGAGFDLAWARDGEGDPVAPDQARFLRIDVLDGRVEFDAVVAVSPGDGGRAVRIVEDFGEDPLQGGWVRSPEDESFRWDGERLRVVWDSSGPNRYFHLPLDDSVTRRRSFSWSFDLMLESIGIGTTPGKEGTFPIALGLLDLDEATRGDFYRGSGNHEEHGPRSIVEWSYFPDSGFGATVSSGLISRDNQWAFQNSFPLELEPEALYHVEMTYRASSGTMVTTMTEDGEAFGPLEEARLSDIFGSPSLFTDLEVDVLAICNYSDGGQDPDFAGSVRAIGYIDNLVLEVDPPVRPAPIAEIERSGDGLRIGFEARADRSFWLETTTDFSRWMTVDHLHATEEGPAGFVVSPGGAASAFFRIRQGHR